MQILSSFISLNMIKKHPELEIVFIRKINIGSSCFHRSVYNIPETLPSSAKGFEIFPKFFNKPHKKRGPI